MSQRVMASDTQNSAAISMWRSKPFWLLTSSTFLFFLSFNLIIPELNDMISDLGGAAQKGMIFTLFTLAAALSRPISGKLSDEWGRKPVIVFGLLVSVSCLAFYPIMALVSTFLLLRFLHGFSTGFSPTGSSAMITDIVPAKSRGMAMGMFSVVVSSAMGGGQFLGSLVAKGIGADGLFYVSAALGLIALVMLFKLKETLPDSKPLKEVDLRLRPKDVFMLKVWIPSSIMFVSTVGVGVLFVMTPDISKSFGFASKGWYLGMYVLSTVVFRYFAGKASDKYGRRNNLIVGMVLLGLSFFVSAIPDPTAFTIGAIMFGAAAGINSPSFSAWAADLAEANERGRAFSTLFIALEIGIGLGAALCDLFYQGDFSDYGIMFVVMGGINIVAGLALLAIRPSHPYYR